VEGSITLKTLPRWVRTGDEVIIEKNNEMFIVDRLKVNPLRPLIIHAEGAHGMCRKL
jgi:acyl-CoA synthetase (AMP-forming)/AMP-acid ligase II